MSLVTKIMADLEAAGLNAAEKVAVESSISKHLPPKTYILAVVFLGLITLSLALGAIYLVSNEAMNVDPLWGVLGAGIGGLAGIFVAQGD